MKTRQPVNQHAANLHSHFPSGRSILEFGQVQVAPIWLLFVSRQRSQEAAAHADGPDGG